MFFLMLLLAVPDANPDSTFESLHSVLEYQHRVWEERWGSVPTSFPHVFEGECLFASCCAYGREHLATTEIHVYSVEGDTSTVAFALGKGARFVPLGGNLHVLAPGVESSLFGSSDTTYFAQTLYLPSQVLAWKSGEYFLHSLDASKVRSRPTLQWWVRVKCRDAHALPRSRLGARQGTRDSL